MILFRDNKLIILSDKEDSKDNLKITITPEHARSKFHIKDAIYELKCFNDGYTFVCVQSPYSDDSGIGRRLTSPKQHIGGAIAEAHLYKYNVYNGDILLSKEIIK